MAGAGVLPRLRDRLALDGLITAAAIVFAATTLILGRTRTPGVALAAMFAGGVAWIANMATLNFAAQRAAAGWVRARVMSFLVLANQAGLALGSLAWGAVAAKWGTEAALTGSAVTMVLATLPAKRVRIGAGPDRDLEPSLHWPSPLAATPPRPDDGPVLVTVEYRVPSPAADEFLAAIHALSRTRRRGGAFEWAVYRDVADPERFVETFHVESWAEHLRSGSRHPSPRS